MTRSYILIYKNLHCSLNNSPNHLLFASSSSYFIIVHELNITRLRSIYKIACIAFLISIGQNLFNKMSLMLRHVTVWCFDWFRKMKIIVREISHDFLANSIAVCTWLRRAWAWLLLFIIIIVAAIIIIITFSIATFIFWFMLSFSWAFPYENI